MKTAAIRGYGGLVLFLNNATGTGECYDMQKRAIKGDHDWTQVEFVADVPPELVSITIGVNIEGRGTVWMDDLKFEVVGSEVPLTPAYHAARTTAPRRIILTPAIITCTERVLRGAFGVKRLALRFGMQEAGGMFWNC